MEWMEMFQDIFELVIVPLLVVLSGYVIRFINLKSVELTNKVDNEKHDKYILMLQETVTDCVLTTTQTYVDALKGQNAFDLEAQKTAFEMTKNAVLAILAEDAKEYLNSALGDFDEYLKTLIEAQVQVNKIATAN